MTALVVLAVAAFAFVISFSHLYDLAHAHGQFGVAAALMPLSVDCQRKLKSDQLTASEM